MGPLEAPSASSRLPVHVVTGVRVYRRVCLQAVCAHFTVHTRIPLRCQPRQPGCGDNLVAAATPGSQTVVSNTVPNRANQGPFRMAGSVNGRET